MPSAFYLSAAHKSSGKTLISLGLCAAFRQQSLKVQSFKKGPDYIDPIWLAQASGHPCYNLDFHNMSQAQILALYQAQASGSDISLVEGNKGLFDGMNTTGGDANADMAKLLDLPVVLVLDTIGTTRGIAPLVKGYQDFDAELNIAGVILNKVGGARHESKLVSALEYYTDVDILGSVHKSKELVIDERHLGLMPANESARSEKIIDGVGSIIADQVDLSRLSEINPVNYPSSPIVAPAEKGLRLAVAKDESFGFYYQDDLDAFAELGVEICYFNTLTDAAVPEADALFIGGGFPEMNLRALSNNTALLTDIKTKIEAGLPTYAECGGLMYLTHSIAQQGQSYPMVGVIDAKTQMTPKPIGRGYVELAPSDEHPWQDVSAHIYAHEFHYSKLTEINPNTRYGFKVLRGVGVDNNQDGIIKHNMLATYTHLRNVGGNKWVEQFVNFIKTRL